MVKCAHIRIDRNRHRLHVSTTALSGGLSLLLSAAALPAAAADAPQTAQAAAIEEVVVTGTRIVRDGFEAPTPVTVLNSDQILRDAPQSITDFLAKQPAFSNSMTTRYNKGGISGAGSGLNNVNLRAVGANRTLVLLDGVRVVGGSISGFYQNGGSPDISMFPDSLISRVDVVTGGASAPYGSDAMAGVVNFILDKEYTGVKGSVQGGVTTYGDDRQYSVSLTAGTAFANGRGHFLVNASHNWVEGIDKFGARAWQADAWGRVVNPNYTATNGQPFNLIRAHVGAMNTAPGSIITSGPLKNIVFGPGGTPRVFNLGSLSNGSVVVDGDWALTPNSLADGSLDAHLSRQDLFVRASYNVAEDAEIYVQYLDSFVASLSHSSLYSRTGVTIPNANPFIPADILARMTALGVTSIPVAFNMADQGLAGVEVGRHSNHYVVGTRGKFDAMDTSWKWDVYATRSLSRTSAAPTHTVLLPNLARALDVVRSPTTGIPVCRSTLTNPTDGCVPWNPLGIGVNSTAAQNYVFPENLSHMNQNLQQTVLSASLSGEPFSSWAGPVSVAFGAEHREEKLTTRTTALDEATSFHVGNFKTSTGDYHINEGFLETVVPLAKDTAWAKSFEFNGAVRATDYSTSGYVTTWKVGATYSPIDDIRFRTTRSLDIRSPNMGEMFQAGLLATTSLRDTFRNNQTYQFVAVTTGNPGLAPERSSTFGGGVVIQPRFWPGFHASFDYYDMNIKGAISAVPSQDIIDLCYAGNQTLCALITRAAPGAGEQYGLITTITRKPTNTDALTTSGFDVETSYTQKLGEISDSWDGSVTARVLVTRVIDLTSVSITAGRQQGAGVAGGAMYPNMIAPRWRYSLSLSYDSDAFGLSATGRGFSAGVQDSQWIQCQSACPASVAPALTTDNNYAPPAFYTDLSFTYHVMRDSDVTSDVFFVVENLSNKQPIGYEMLGFAPGYYDTIGRSFRAGVRFKM